MSNDIITISKETVKRLTKDIREIRKNPLDIEGIYYEHDDTNILQGYAYISGPKDSLYFGGNYFFKFLFPCDYPYKPPKVTFCVNDSETRFHPNLYRSGKICLSILNTWRGDQWTGCQTIKSVLLTITSIMDKEPLLHEPGITKKHPDFENYSNIILYKNINHSINHVLNNKSQYKQFFDLFEEKIIENFKNNKNDVLTILEANKNKKKNKEVCRLRTGVYSMNINIDWNHCYNDFIKIKL